MITGVIDMDSAFEKRLADFLEESMGEWMSELSANNSKYREHLEERDKIIEIIENSGIKSRIRELNAEIQEAESHFLFLAGMRTFAKIAKSIESNGFINYFLDIDNKAE